MAKDITGGEESFAYPDKLSPLEERFMRVSLGSYLATKTPLGAVF